MLSTPLFVIAIAPHPDANSDKVASKGFLRFEWPGKGICVALFTSEIIGRQFLADHPPMDCGGLCIRDPQELADILEVCRTDGNAQWAAVDPLDLSDGRHCLPIQKAIDDLLKQDRDSHSSE